MTRIKSWASGKSYEFQRKYSLQKIYLNERNIHWYLRARQPAEGTHIVCLVFHPLPDGDPCPFPPSGCPRLVMPVNTRQRKGIVTGIGEKNLERTIIFCILLAVFLLVGVADGIITVRGDGDLNYYFGETVMLYGTNTESSAVYLYITGPGLPAEGGSLTSPLSPVTSYPGTFTIADVQPDKSWWYSWNTKALNLQEGDYIIHAVISPSTVSGTSPSNSAITVSLNNLFIRIDAIGDRHVGDKFTITSRTNLPADDEILVQVYSSSFKPTQKSQSGEFSGATGTVRVTRSDSGRNRILFDVDLSTFKPDEYIVTETSVLQDITGTALFMVLDQTVPPTTTPTPVSPVTTTPAPVTPTPVVTRITTPPTPVRPTTPVITLTTSSGGQWPPIDQIVAGAVGICAVIAVVFLLTGGGGTAGAGAGSSAGSGTTGDGAPAEPAGPGFELEVRRGIEVTGMDCGDYDIRLETGAGIECPDENGGKGG
jgi:hypothetical protein